MTKCLCLGGCAVATTYKVFDPATVKYSGSITLCMVCETKMSSEPTLREKQFKAGTLRWQSWPDRTPCVPLPDIDFATAKCSALPTDYSNTDGDEQWETLEPTLVSETPVTLPNGDESGTGAGLICQNWTT